ncbi:MAG: hypothetical protein VKJ04_05285 [Vampirovibrionales bacterium]|nr:hypothetical protein [Vampirovibrionales bacterium]
MSLLPEIDFLKEATSDQVVKATLRILCTYHEIQTERISSLIYGLDEQYTKFLEKTWERLKYAQNCPMDALGTLTRIITADLEAYRNGLEKEQGSEASEQHTQN